MTPTPRFFRELWSGAREVNYGNTVLVHRDGGHWWMGYVQDVKEQDFLVDFDASTATPEWVHSSNLWPHHSWWDDLEPFVGTIVQVTLRERHGGPLVFRPVTAVAQLQDFLLAVCLDAKRPSDCFFVHPTRFVDHLPVPGDGQSFYARTDGLTYAKHVIHFPAAGRMRSVDCLPAFLESTCRLTLAEGDHLIGNPLVRRVYGDSTPFYSAPRQEIDGVHVGFRGFVRASMDTVTVVCMELHNKATGHRMSWNEKALKKACNEYLRKHLADIVNVVPRKLEYGFSSEYSAHAEEMSINELSPPILICILTSVDADNQLRFSWVCALWSEIGRKYQDKRLVILDSAQIWPRKPYAHEYYIEFAYRHFKLQTTLDRTITKETTRLALMDDRDDSRSAINLIMKMEAVKVVLEAKGSRLSSIVVRYNGSGVAERSETFLAVDVDEDTMLANEDAIDVNDDQYILRHVVDVLRVCDELTLVNYKPSKSITGSVWYMLSGSSITVPMSLMARLRSDHDKIDLGVTIPFLRFRAGEAATEQRRRFLAAANDNCPAVGEAVQQKVTTLFARWLEKLGDREWIGVCRFLKLFNSLGPDDNPHRWDTIDRFDLSQLNNLTFAALHGCFRDGRRHRK